LPPRTAPIGGGATIVFQAGAALNLLDAGAETISQISGATQPAGPAAISPDGRLVLFDGVIEGKRRIFSYDRTSKEVKQYVPGDDEAFHPFWAPDGSRVVYAAVRDGNTDIWQMDVRTQGMERLTDDPAEDDYPSYSPDGSKIVWERRRPEGWRIFSMDRDGERRIVDPPGGADDRYPRISPDGNRLVFASSRGRVDGGLDLFVVPLDGGAPVRLTDPRRGSSQGPQWSPDGKMLVFFGDPAGNDDIFTLRLSEPERITAVTHTAEDERWPTWGP
jgi:Tol biopolymer transport system component